ncbi:hypothetical protein Tco_0531580 [Tanacetum coccineum]
MLLNLDQLEKQLDKDEFQEIGSMDAFRVLMTQFQTFIKEQYYFIDFDGPMICKYFLAYTRTEVRQFRDTLIQHMDPVKKSIDERAQLKRQYDRRVNKRLIRMQERAGLKTIEPGFELKALKTGRMGSKWVVRLEMELRGFKTWLLLLITALGILGIFLIRT